MNDAFKGRGNNDLFGSHDFEDIIAIIVGRLEIVSEIAASGSELKSYLKSFFIELLKNNQFEQILPGHLTDGPATVTMQRVQRVMNHIKTLTSSSP